MGTNLLSGGRAQADNAGSLAVDFGKDNRMQRTFSERRNIDPAALATSHAI
jgi:hypothetical protein